MKHVARHHTVRALPLAVLLALAASHPVRAAEPTLQELKAQIEALQKSLAALEQKQKAVETQTAPANAVTAGNTKGSFKLPGSDTSIKLSGYVKGDVIYSSRSAGANSQADQVLVPGSIPVGNSAEYEKGQLKLHARQTRLGIGTSTPTAWGDLNTYIESDFFGADGNEVVSNSSNLRVRHAWGSLGNLLVGQTWTTFMDPAALPETLDFGGPVGEVFIRQAQMRWSQKFDGGAWHVAVESPDSYLTRQKLDGSLATAIPDDDRSPELVGKVEFNTSAGRYSVAGMARQIRIDAPAEAGNPAARDQRWGGALAVYGVVPTVGKDQFSFSLAGGNALGRYIGQGVFTDANVDGAGKLDLGTRWGAILAYRHYWNDTLRSNLALSAAHADNPDKAGSMNKASQTAHLNLLWNPTPATTLGVEYIYGRLEKESGLSGTLNRLQFSGQYSF